MSTDAPIMVRAKISAAEWAEIRKLAIDRNQSTSELVGDSLRATLKGKDDTDA